MSKSSHFALPQHSSHLPNEMLYEILADVIMEDLHTRIMREDMNTTNKPRWNPFVVLPHVSRVFRGTSIRIYASALAIPRGKCDRWLLERIHQRFKRLPRVSLRVPQRFKINETSLILVKDMINLNMIARGDYTKPPKPGILIVYEFASQSSFVCREVLRRGFDNVASTQPEVIEYGIRCLMGLLRGAMFNCLSLKPAKLSYLASEVVITHCATSLLTFMLWIYKKMMPVTKPLHDPAAYEEYTTCLDAFESYETDVMSLVPSRFIAQHCSTKRLLTRTILEDSGVVPVLQEIRNRKADDPHKFKVRAEKLLESWKSLLQDGPLSDKDGFGSGAVE